MHSLLVETMPSGYFFSGVGVSAGSGALHYAKYLFKPEEMVLRSKYPPYF